MKNLIFLLVIVSAIGCAKLQKKVQEEVLELSTINCHMQSPVNIIPGKEKGSMHKVLVHYETSKERVANLGHTVEVVYDSGSYVTYDSINYQFEQFHFHTPSEHQVASQSFDMEMHIVHTNLDKGADNPEYLVIGVFFDEGEQSDFLNTFLDAIPSEEGEIYESNKKYVNASEMIPEQLHDFYNYRGSLTTPPFTEAVNWIVLKEHKTASKGQIEKIFAIEGENARQVQALYDRVVERVN